jgi:hypothetical protein
VQKEKGEGGLFTQHSVIEKAKENLPLCKELIDNEVKFYGYFRMNGECFCALLEKMSPLLIKQMKFQKPVSPKERLAVCIR